MKNYFSLSSAFVLMALAGSTSEASAADQRFMQGSDYGAPRLNPTTAASLESSLADLAQSLTKLTHTLSTALQGAPSTSSAEEGRSEKSGFRESVQILRGPEEGQLFKVSTWIFLNPQAKKREILNKSNGQISMQYAFQKRTAKGIEWDILGDGPNDFFTGNELSMIDTWQQTARPDVLIGNKYFAFQLLGKDYLPTEPSWYLIPQKNGILKKNGILTPFDQLRFGMAMPQR